MPTHFSEQSQNGLYSLRCVRKTWKMPLIQTWADFVAAKDSSAGDTADCQEQQPWEPSLLTAWVCSWANSYKNAGIVLLQQKDTVTHSEGEVWTPEPGLDLKRDLTWGCSLHGTIPMDSASQGQIFSSLPAGQTCANWFDVYMNMRNSCPLQTRGFKFFKLMDITGWHYCPQLPAWVNEVKAQCLRGSVGGPCVSLIQSQSSFDYLGCE